jgi:hypothetical protein
MGEDGERRKGNGKLGRKIEVRGKEENGKFPPFCVSSFL